MYAIIGLGNIGNGYKNTYHNIGFMAVDKLAKDLNIKFDTQKCKAELGFGMIGDEEVVLVKPTTFMNLSGQAVDEVMRKFKIKKNHLIIILDDIDLERGKLRYRASGSGGTHNGLKNIVQVVGSTEIPRLRIGAGRDERMDLKDFVLSKIDPYAMQEIEPAINKGLEIIKNKIVNNTVLNNDIQC
ncbi:MAG: aminoacyl-tRNA hydrolase [Christensenellales bacterium]